jgi:hypothetical protein
VNLYSVTRGEEAMPAPLSGSRATRRAIFLAVYPDTMTPVVRVARPWSIIFSSRSLSASMTSISYGLAVTIILRLFALREE